MRMVVVLPAPFGPRNPRISPGSTRKLMSSTAVNDPYRLVTCWTSTTLFSPGTEWGPARGPRRPDRLARQRGPASVLDCIRRGAWRKRRPPSCNCQHGLLVTGGSVSSHTRLVRGRGCRGLPLLDIFINGGLVAGVHSFELDPHADPPVTPDHAGVGLDLAG